MEIKTKSMPTDNELYNLYLSGDSASYDQLMIRYGDSLTVFLYGYLHNWEDAEDLMIESFARIMVKKPHIREDGFRAYLYKTARNLASRLNGYKIRTETFSLDGVEAEIKDKTDIEMQFQGDEKKRILQLCLQRIEPELKEALWLVYVEGMSYPDAAAVMKVKRKRIDRIVQKAKEHLRLELDREGIKDAFA